MGKSKRKNRKKNRSGHRNNFLDPVTTVISVKTFRVSEQDKNKPDLSVLGKKRISMAANGSRSYCESETRPKFTRITQIICEPAVIKDFRINCAQQSHIEHEKELVLPVRTRVRSKNSESKTESTTPDVSAANVKIEIDEAEEEMPVEIDFYPKIKQEIQAKEEPEETVSRCFDGGQSDLMSNKVDSFLAILEDIRNRSENSCTATTVGNFTRSQKETQPPQQQTTFEGHDGTYLCLWCSLIFYESVDRDNHMKLSHQRQYFEMRKSYQFIDSASEQVCRMPNLQHHDSICSVHESSTTSPSVGCDKKGLYKCEMCDSSFKSKKSLIHHRKTHLELGVFQCVMCFKTFKLRSVLNDHVKTHLEDSPFKCDLCDRSFRSKSSREYHRKTHTQVGVFKCVMCGRVFHCRYALKIHRKTHSELRPYKCDICPRAFSSSSNREYHRRYHTDLDWL